MDIDFEDYFQVEDTDTDPRTIAVFYNQSDTVFYGAIALGVFFTATAIGLIIYYLSTLGGGAGIGGGGGGGSSSYGRSYDEWSAPNARLDSLAWLRVLEELERAFALYGVHESENDCREKLICEVYKPGAVDANLAASLRFSGVVGKLTPEVTAHLDSPGLRNTKRLLDAANRGRKKGDCEPYEQLCKKYSLQSLTPLQSKVNLKAKSLVSLINGRR
ncbi:hypothetical protein FHG87_014326 [Trinorchestia longiramus]|nr:hypothetical protein FHG87_014326 [Trinorchestia longiramus]